MLKTMVEVLECWGAHFMAVLAMVVPVVRDMMIQIPAKLATQMVVTSASVGSGSAIIPLRTLWTVVVVALVEAVVTAVGWGMTALEDLVEEEVVVVTMKQEVVVLAVVAAAEIQQAGVCSLVVMDRELIPAVVAGVGSEAQFSITGACYFSPIAP
jgi:hypothetical protein